MNDIYNYDDNVKVDDVSESGFIYNAGTNVTINASDGNDTVRNYGDTVVVESNGGDGNDDNGTDNNYNPVDSGNPEPEATEENDANIAQHRNPPVDGSETPEQQNGSDNVPGTNGGKVKVISNNSKNSDTTQNVEVKGLPISSGLGAFLAEVDRVLEKQAISDINKMFNIVYGGGVKVISNNPKNSDTTQNVEVKGLPISSGLGALQAEVAKVIEKQEKCAQNPVPVKDGNPAQNKEDMSELKELNFSATEEEEVASANTDGTNNNSNIIDNNSLVEDLDFTDEIPRPVSEQEFWNIVQKSAEENKKELEQLEKEMETTTF